METCCNSYYSNCSGLVPCFDYLYVRTPPSYEPTDICLKVIKNDQANGVTIDSIVTISNGWAVLDIVLFPNGFFTPYAKYRLEFWNSSAMVQIDFIANDGNPYGGIDFFFANNPMATSIINLNAIDNAYYD